jgi:hypothetical protein
MRKPERWLSVGFGGRSTKKGPKGTEANASWPSHLRWRIPASGHIGDSTPGSRGMAVRSHPATHAGYPAPDDYAPYSGRKLTLVIPKKPATDSMCVRSRANKFANTDLGFRRQRPLPWSRNFSTMGMRCLTSFQCPARRMPQGPPDAGHGLGGKLPRPWVGAASRFLAQRARGRSLYVNLWATAVVVCARVIERLGRLAVPGRRAPYRPTQPPCTGCCEAMNSR